MSSASLSTTSESKNLSSFGTNSERAFEQIAEILPNGPIYAKLGNDYKGGTETGYHDNLLTKQQALNHVRQGGNVGIKLGDWFNGITFASFDVEEKGTLPEDIRSVIDTHAVVTWDSPHGGMNRLVKIDNTDAYELLRSYPKAIDDITDNDLDDIEIWTKNHAVIPPSSIHHTHCSDDKAERGCPGRGTDRYVLEATSYVEPLSVSSIERLGDLLQLEPTKAKEPELPGTDDVTNVPSPFPTFNPKKEFKNTVPHVFHGFDERRDYMFYGDHKNQPIIERIRNRDFSDFSGSNIQGRAECYYANTVGFYFGRNEKFIRHFMSTLPWETYYEKYPRHRKALLDFATSVDWCYSKGVSFNCKLDVASWIYIEGRTTVNGLADVTEYGDRQIRRTLPILKAEGVIDIHTGERTERIITNEGIAEGYLLSLEGVISKYETDEQNDNHEVAIDRIKI